MGVAEDANVLVYCAVKARLEHIERKFACMLARGLSVLSAFRSSDDGSTQVQIAARTKLSKWTISCVTNRLRALGHRSHRGRNVRFQRDPAAILVGSVTTRTMGFVVPVSDAIQALADEIGTLAPSVVRSANRMMLDKTWRPGGPASIWLDPGHLVPTYGSSSGQAVLAGLSKKRFEAMLPDPTLRSIMRNFETRTGQPHAKARWVQNI